ncbi:MAG TPA: helix-turn-helix transcriptional regulator [Rubrivivax sp.]|nr:helix-turn-helix transcriptional regulator [Rubrivivax sp.]
MSAVLQPPPFGSQLRRWRGQRGLSQLALALQADVSARHLSWLETGKAEPSRAMVLRLAEQLDLPLRERNALLVAAGYAPLYRESSLDDAALAPARGALQRLLDAQEPSPALAVDRLWNVIAHNRMLPLMLQMVAPELQQPPVNALRVSLHPQGFAPMIENLPAWRAHSLARVRRQARASGDPRLAALLAELLSYPGALAGEDEPGPGVDDVIVPIVINSPLGRFDFITTITVFGAPHDVTLAEIAVETLLPADRATADRLQQLLASSVS